MSIYKSLVLSSLLVFGISANFSGVEILSSKQNKSVTEQSIASSFEGPEGTQPEDHRGSGR